MANGYTWPVKDGSVTELKDFVLRCARSIGYFYQQRDDAADRPLRPYEIDKRYYDAVREAEELLAKYRAMSLDDFQEFADADYAERVKANEDCAKIDAQTLARFVAMREKVEAWKPPTPEHVDLKRLMLDEINSAITYEGDPTPPRVVERHTPEYMRKMHVEMAEESLRRASQMLKREHERKAKVDAYLKALLESL